jgi:hypothetical protein
VYVMHSQEYLTLLRRKMQGIRTVISSRCNDSCGAQTRVCATHDLALQRLPPSV